LDAGGIEGARDGGAGSEDRLHLAREVETPAVLAEVQRADARGVARHDEPPCGRIPERHGPLAVETLEGALTPGLPRMEDDFGIALRPELVAERDELVAQLDVVEDLAVEHQPC